MEKPVTVSGLVPLATGHIRFHEGSRRSFVYIYVVSHYASNAGFWCTNLLSRFIFTLL